MSENENRIVVGFDGSRQSKDALRWAAEFSRLTGARVDAVTVLYYPAYFEYSYPYERWETDRDPEADFDAAMEELFPQGRPKQFSLSVHKGDPAEVLVDQSRSATLLVVGNRGRGGFGSLLMGSVSSKCVHHSDCPVLVVRGTKDAHLEPQPEAV